MALYMIRTGSWGFELNLVRAGSPEEARRITNVGSDAECEELREGNGILWSYEQEGPDSRD
jgi:hypothetical protein